MFVHQKLDPNERFRERRRQVRRRARRRRLLAAVLLSALGAGIAVGATSRGHESAGAPAAAKAAAKAAETPQVKKPAPLRPRALPDEIRGVHVTMALASLEGKLDEYLELQAHGLNTIQLDVKDENGEIGWVMSSVPLAVSTGAAKPYYRPREAVRRIHARGMYLIGRVVVFEDPVLSRQRPDMALRRPDGSVWRNSAGLGWSNQYDRRVWKYNVDIAVAAARAGFDEIQFDYVRFPSDGDVDSIVYPRKRPEPKGKTIAAFLRYAAKRLRPLGVRVSADVFGLSAKRDLGIGQVPLWIAREVDAIYPMTYPSHYGPGEYGLEDPVADPGPTVARSLRDFKRQIRGTKAKLIPWIQDFSLGRTYTFYEVAEQIQAARLQGAKGFLLWNPVGVYTPKALAYR